MDKTLEEKAYWELDELRKNQVERIGFKLIVKSLPPNLENNKEQK